MGNLRRHGDGSGIRSGVSATDGEILLRGWKGRIQDGYVVFSEGECVYEK